MVDQEGGTNYSDSAGFNGLRVSLEPVTMTKSNDVVKTLGGVSRQVAVTGRNDSRQDCPGQGSAGCVFSGGIADGWLQLVVWH